ncbi:MAG: cell envelope integrity protein TolA [Reinekea sp.]
MSKAAAAVQGGKDFTLPMIGAVFVHVIVAVLLFGSWHFSLQKTVEFHVPQHIQAELVTVARPKPEPVKQPVVKKPKPVEPKPKPKPTPKPEPKPVVQDKVAPKPEVPPVPAVKQPEPTVKEPEPAAKPEKTPQPVAELPAPVEPDLPSEESLFENLLAGAVAEDVKINEQVAALEQRRKREVEIQSEVDKYSAGITAQISQKWSRPRDQLIDVANLQAEVLVELLPTGELKKATLTKSSGNARYDQSVIRAIEKVLRFNVPDDPEVFEKGEFRNMRVTFTPEDLMGL